MNRILIIACAFVLTFVTGCNQGSSKVRIKKIVSGRGISTEYFYDADGNITSTKNSEGVKTTYKYSGSKVVEDITDSVHHMNVTSNIFLSSKGTADSSSAKDENENYLKTYVHDAEGHIIESKDFSGSAISSISKSVFKDGNQVTITILDSVSKPLVTVFLEYYPDKINTVGYGNYGMKFLGVDSKNLLKKFVQVLPSGDTMRMSNLVYHYDDKGRVIAKVMLDQRGITADSSSYTYY